MLSNGAENFISKESPPLGADIRGGECCSNTDFMSDGGANRPTTLEMVLGRTGGAKPNGAGASLEDFRADFGTSKIILYILLFTFYSIFTNKVPKMYNFELFFVAPSATHI